MESNKVTRDKFKSAPHGISAMVKTSLFILFTILNLNIHAQNRANYVTRLGGGVQSFCSGNGLGSFYRPYVSLTRGRNTLIAGPVIQKRSLALGGAKLGLSHNLTGSPCNNIADNFCIDLLQLNVFCYLQYTENMNLSYNASNAEQIRKLDNSTNWNKVKLSTAEMGTGFELQVNITKKISWKNYIGATVYYHTNYIKGMNLDRIAPVLSMGTGISFFIQ